MHVRLPVHDLPAHHARVRVHWPSVPVRYPARDFPCRARMPKYQTKAIPAARIRLSVRWDVTHRALRMGCATPCRSVKIIAETVRADAVETCRCIYLVPGSYIPRNLRLISSLSPSLPTSSLRNHIDNDGVDKETTGLLGSPWGEWLEFGGRSVRKCPMT